MAVRKPSPPKFTANSGISSLPMARAAESNVPSPPSTITRSQPCGTSPRGMPCAAGAYTAVSTSQRTAMARSRSHSSSRGTIARASAEFGLEQMPTVLMVGIEQELLVPFGAEDGAFDHIGAEAEIRRGPFDTLARRLVNLGPAYDAALAHLAPA